MKRIRFSFLAAAALAFVSSSASAQQPQHGGSHLQNTDQIEAGVGADGLPRGQPRPMTVAFAKRLVAAAIKASCAPPAGSCSGVFAVADDAGVIVYLESIDGVLAGGPDLAMKKAKTPALWRRPTQVFHDAVKNQTNLAYTDGAFIEMTLSPGGVPIVKDGRIVGGFGIAAVGHGSKQILDATLAEAEKIFGKQ